MTIRQSFKLFLPAALVVVLSGLGYFQYQLHNQLDELHNQLDELKWQLALQDHNRKLGEKRISLDVGVIQFIQRGFSMTLDKVDYNANGVTLVGTVGNPTLLGVSSLTLIFEVNRPFYEFSKQYNTVGFLIDNPRLVGTAQVSVGDVAPGSIAQFNVTIPNVTQATKNEYEVSAQFSNERYQYLR